MQPDDELCLCFHVSKRKVVNYLRLKQPRAASQLSECHGAGTGCGWCRKMLVGLFEAWQIAAEGEPPDGAKPIEITLPDETTAAEYAKGRTAYVRAGGGTPPSGATPKPVLSSPSGLAISFSKTSRILSPVARFTISARMKPPLTA